MSGNNTGYPNLDFLSEDDLSLKELLKYGYFDQYNHFRERKNQQQIEQDFSIKFSDVDLPYTLSASFDLSKYRYNNFYMPSLSAQERVKKYLLDHSENQRQTSIPNILYARDVIYYSFLTDKDKDLMKFTDGETEINDPTFFSEEEKECVRLQFQHLSKMYQVEFKECSPDDVRNKKVQSKCKPFLFIKNELDNLPCVVAETNFNQQEYVYMTANYPKGKSVSLESIKNYFDFLLTHEIGHLDKEHTFYNADHYYDQNTVEHVKINTHLEECNSHSAMSYSTHPAIKNIILSPDKNTYSTGLMHDDILATVNFWKLNLEHNKGPSYYTVPKGDYSYSTISDRSGTDTVDFSQHEYSWIDLSHEGFSSGDTLPFQRTIGPFTYMENAQASSKFAFILGNDLDNEVSAKENAVFLTGRGSDTHYEGTGKNIHFFILGTGHDVIIPAGGQTEIHLMHYFKNDFVATENKKTFNLVHLTTGDQISYIKPNNFDPKKVKVIVGKHAYSFADFIITKNMDCLDRPQFDSTKLIIKETKKSVPLSEYVKNVSSEEVIQVTDLDKDGNAKPVLYDKQLKKYILQGIPHETKLGNLEIHAADSFQAYQDNILIKVPSKKHASILRLYRSPKTPSLKAVKYFVRNGAEYKLDQLLQSEKSTEGIQAISVRNFDPKHFEFALAKDVNKAVASQGNIKKFEVTNLNQLKLISKNPSDSRVGHFKIQLHYQNYTTQPFSFGVKSRENLLPVAMDETYSGNILEKDKSITLNFEQYSPGKHPDYIDPDGDPLHKVEIIIDQLPQTVDTTLHLVDQINDNLSLEYKPQKVSIGDKIVLDGPEDSLVLSNLKSDMQVFTRVRFHDGQAWSEYSNIIEFTQ